MEKKYLTIVFDDGPLPYMCEMIDLFNQYGFKAGFAVMGSRITPDTEHMIEYAIDNGFQLVGHSQTHPRLETITSEQVVDELTTPINNIKNRLDVSLSIDEDLFLLKDALRDILKNKNHYQKVHILIVIFFCKF